jgi:pSer/pThr/pTyr-binding forkhead associated (FHA) protein
MSKTGASPAELKQQIEAERRGLPFLVYRDGGDRQQILALGEGTQHVTIGRGSGTDIWLDWDSEVSRVHTELERIGDAWTAVDDGLSRNGSYVNGERLTGRQRLRDGDVLRIGGTAILFRDPVEEEVGETVASSDVLSAPLSKAQRRVLVALCRPFKEDRAYAAPATNQQIADELFLSVNGVKTHLRALFAKFGLEDLPQNQKRLTLVEKAMTSGIVQPRDL